MSTRREFLQETAYGTLAAFTGLPQATDVGLVPSGEQAPQPDLDSDVGSLYPFVKSQAAAGEFPLSFLQGEFADVAAWKRAARGKVLDLLHYAPPPCDPKAETVARVDRGEFVQEKVYFNTTPDVRVAAFVLIPKKSRRPAPGIVALPDHGGVAIFKARPGSRLGHKRDRLLSGSKTGWCYRPLLSPIQTTAVRVHYVRFSPMRMTVT